MNKQTAFELGKLVHNWRNQPRPRGPGSALRNLVYAACADELEALVRRLIAEGST